MRVDPIVLVGVKSIYFLVEVGKIEFLLGVEIRFYDVGPHFRLPGERFPTSPGPGWGDDLEEFVVVALRVRRYVNHTAVFFWIAQFLVLPFGWMGVTGS